MIDFRGLLDEATWATIGAALAQDGLLLVPTETVYGVAASALRPAAVARSSGSKAASRASRCNCSSPHRSRPALAGEWPVEAQRWPTPAGPDR